MSCPDFISTHGTGGPHSFAATLAFRPLSQVSMNVFRSSFLEGSTSLLPMGDKCEVVGPALSQMLCFTAIAHSLVSANRPTIAKVGYTHTQTALSTWSSKRTHGLNGDMFEEAKKSTLFRMQCFASHIVVGQNNNILFFKFCFYRSNFTKILILR